MKVTFYGTRGSLPVSEKEFSTFGGNTACILLSFKNGRVAILDAGTGIRKVGNDFPAKNIEQYDNIFIGLSHTHWYHIQGFPFFQPAYDPKRHFTIAVFGKGQHSTDLESIFATLMLQEYFPVPLDKMGATLTFLRIDRSCYTAPSGIRVVALRHNHPGDAYGYRVTEGKTSLVYCTDIEHGESIDARIVSLARNADLLIHDARYSGDELKEKRGWGHSSWEQAVEVAKQANAKRLALFHHDPEHNDAFILKMEKECQKIFSKAFFAREGMEIEI